MPRRDKTGPEGQGPMTGRKQGVCQPDMEKNSSPRFGRGGLRRNRTLNEDVSSTKTTENEKSN